MSSCCGRPRRITNAGQPLKLDRLPSNISSLVNKSPTCSKCTTSMNLITAYPVGNKRYQQWQCPACSTLKGTYLD